MARIIPFNKQGTIGLETIGAKIENNTLIYEFEAHPYVNTPFNGVLLIHLKSPSPAGLTPTMPVFFETRGVANSRKAVTKAGGVPMTAADIAIPCYAQFFYDFRSGIVEAIVGIIPNQPTSN